MKLTTLALAASLLLPSLSIAQHLDGAWLANENYGAAGDQVVGQVKAQISDYADAKRHALAVQSGAEKGDLRSAQQECVDTALYSWVQANYLAEMGRVSAKQGKTDQAISDYGKALEAATRAQEVDCNEEAKTQKSKEQGAIIEKVIRRALKRLGVE